jgi:hypothetical protein
MTAEKLLVRGQQWGFAQEAPHLPDGAPERAVAMTAEEFLGQWMEGFAQGALHLPNAAPERAVAMTAEEFLAQWMEGLV